MAVAKELKKTQVRLFNVIPKNSLHPILHKVLRLMKFS